MVLRVTGPSRATTRTVTTGLFVAADFVVQSLPIPDANVVLNVVKQILTFCDGIKVHKDEAKELSDHVQSLKKAFVNYRKEVERTGLGESVDQFLSALEDVRDQLETWTSYSWWRSMLYTREIQKGLRACRRKVDDQLQQFSFAQGSATIQKTAELVKLAESDQDKQAEAYESVDRMLKLSMRPDNELTLLNGEPVTRVQFDVISNRMQELVQEMHLRTGHLPIQFRDITDQVTLERQNGVRAPIACMAHSEVYLGYWQKDKRVTVKKLRHIQSHSEKVVKRFLNAFKVAITMKSHPNVLPLLGVMRIEGEIGLVSPYLLNGNIREFCIRHEADPLHLLVGAANGVNYLHSLNIIHGNLKASNVLVNDELEAVLSDFEMAKIVKDIHVELNTHDTFTRTPSLRWAAPELGESSNRIQPRTDSWAFGLVMVETFTGQIPWPTEGRHENIFINVSDKESPLRPSRPDSDWVTDHVWEVIQNCCTWLDDRWEMPKVEEYLRVAEQERKDNPPPPPLRYGNFYGRFSYQRTRRHIAAAEA